jgi:hypothetical protein
MGHTSQKNVYGYVEELQESMDQEPVKLGGSIERSKKRSRKTSERRCGSISSRKIFDKMASKWPTIYLSRISEASKIIKTPDYAAYLEKETPFTSSRNI